VEINSGVYLLTYLVLVLSLICLKNLVLFTSLVDIDYGSSVEIMVEFCYLGDMLSVDGDADAAVTGGTHVVGSGSDYRPAFSLPKMLPLLRRGKIL